MSSPASFGPWAPYAKAQRSSDSHVLDSFSFGYDDAMATVLAELFGGSLASGDIGRRIHSLALNRSRKHRHRQRLHALFRVEHPRDRAERDEITERAANRELLALVRQRVTTTEWQLLWQLAQGATYDELSATSGLSVGQLRTQVARVRRRVREAMHAQVQDLN